MAYLGDPVLAEDLVFRPVHSIIDQSLHAKLTGVTTNGDGFGIGWYGDRPGPSVYKGTHPAWNDANLREVAGDIRTPLLFAHVRASSGTPVQAQQLRERGHLLVGAEPAGSMLALEKCPCLGRHARAHQWRVDEARPDRSGPHTLKVFASEVYSSAATLVRPTRACLQAT